MRWSFQGWVRSTTMLILLACILVGSASAIDLSEAKNTKEKADIKASAIVKDVNITEILSKDTVVKKDTLDDTKGTITINITKLWYENGKVCVKYTARDEGGEYQVINPTCIYNPPVMVATGYNEPDLKSLTPLEEQDLRILNEDPKAALLDVLKQNAITRARGKALFVAGDPTLITYAENDGKMERTSTATGAKTFSELRAAAGNGFGNTTNILSGYQDNFTADGLFTIMVRSAQTYNTTSILPSYSVTSATVSLMGAGRFEANTSLAMVSFNPADKSHYTAEDYAISLWGSTPLADNFSYSQWVNGVYHNFTLYDTSDIVKGGLTTLGYRCTADIDGVNYTYYAAGQTHGLYWYPISTAGTSSDPFITIDYTIPDTTPPGSITGLSDTTTCNSINWTWTNPADADFNSTVIYQNGTFLKNVTNTTVFDTWSNLAELTGYTFSSRTADSAGNINLTWINLSGTTGSCATPTPSPTPTTTPTATLTPAPSLTPAPPGGGSASDSGESGRPSTYVATAPGSPAGQGMTFAVNEPLTAGTVEYPYAIISVEVVPSQTLGATELIVTDVATTDKSQFPGRSTAGIVRIELPGVNPSSISKGTLSFLVAGSWLRQHGLRSDDIVMVRKSGDLWSEVPTSFVNKDKEMYSFTASSPWSSHYAITTRIPATTGNTTMVNTVEPTGSGVIPSFNATGTMSPITSSGASHPSNTTPVTIPLDQPLATQSPPSITVVILVLFILFIVRKTGNL